MSIDTNALEKALSEKFGADYSSDGWWDELEWLLDPNRTYGDELTPDVEVDGVTYDVEVVESDTGGEGHGEYVYVVIKVGDELFRKEGYYASHYGTDWDGRFEKVEAYVEPVTKYRRVS